MFREKRVLFLIAETPVHAGSGSEVGVVDLPIQRERYTDFPKIESSGLKGCIREAFESANKEIDINGEKVRPKNKIQYKKDNQDKETDYISLLFGPEGEETHAGAFTITDARILLFPVKSLKGVFAWITCPMVLERFKRDQEIAGISHFNFSDFSKLVNTVPQSSNIAISSKVVLEEFTFEVREKEETKKLAEWFSNNIFPNNDSYRFWREKIKKDLVILNDDDFKQFVKTSTEIMTRTKIDNVTGTVQSGALWTEEYLPQDTIMYSLVMFTQLRVEEDDKKGIFKAINNPDNEVKLVAEFFEKGLPEVIQIGGNQTIGKGFVRVKFLRQEDKNAS
ncbi:MAG: type III-B CRISPR module RAMP protein Cmr4 [Thermodesulfovibrio sp.]|nr:type III-B CRISPR module RAMP protein Cmr4 [Thermodesulfovibrio sp.]